MLFKAPSPLWLPSSCVKTLCAIFQQTCIERLGFFRNVHRERHLDGATQQGTNVLHQGTAYTEASSRRSHRHDVKVSGHLQKDKVVLLIYFNFLDLHQKSNIYWNIFSNNKSFLRTSWVILSQWKMFDYLSFYIHLFSYVCVELDCFLRYKFGIFHSKEYPSKMISFGLHLDYKKVVQEY